MKNKTKIISLLLAVILVVSFVATKKVLADKKVETKDLTNMEPTYRDVLVADVKNDNGDDRQLKMNIFKPENTTEPTPVLVFIHGGAWTRGDYECDDAPGYESQSASVASSVEDQVAAESTYKVFKRVLNSGITFVSVDYRLNHEAIFPAQIYDVKGSIRYLRAHADEYGIDPDRIAVAGSSAGGHLATLLTTTNNNAELEGDVGGNTEYSSSVMACVDYYGPTDLLTMGPEMSESIQSKEDAAKTHDSTEAVESVLLGFADEGQGVGLLRDLKEKNDTTSQYWNKVELANLGSPVNHVSKDTPPVFIVHGGNDAVVPIAQSYRFRDKLTEAGVENIFMSNSRAPHGFQGEYVNDAAIKWVTDKLNNK